MQLHRALERRSTRLMLCTLNEQPLSLLRQPGFDAVIGDANLQLDLASALASALVSALAPRPAVGAA
jgi:SulP family sulfate permease